MTIKLIKKLNTFYTLVLMEGMFFIHQSMSRRGLSCFPVNITINYLHYVHSLYMKTKETNRQFFFVPELVTKCFSVLRHLSLHGVINPPSLITGQTSAYVSICQ